MQRNHTPSPAQGEKGGDHWWQEEKGGTKQGRESLGLGLASNFSFTIQALSCGKESQGKYGGKKKTVGGKGLRGSIVGEAGGEGGCLKWGVN